MQRKIRKAFLTNKVPILSIGSAGDLTYDYKIIGDKTEDIKKILDDRNEINTILRKSKKPMIIIGESALSTKSGKFILENIKIFFLNIILLMRSGMLNILSKNASTVGAIDIEFFMKDDTFFKKLKNKEYNLLYLVGSDNLQFNKENEFVIYQGSHGDKMAQIADVILPSPAYTEQDGLFINLEGRLQKCVKASYPPGSAKEDWKIFNLISKKISDKFIFKNFNELRENSIKKIKENSGYDSLPKININSIKTEVSDFFNEAVEIDKLDYYFSNAIARSSKTMSDCKIARAKNSKN